MKQTVSRWDFKDAFRRIRPGNFSEAGLNLMFDWLEEYEQDTGTEMELDVIAICCDYSEETPAEIIAEHQMDIPDTVDVEDESEVMGFIVEWLAERTTVIGTTDDTIVYACF